MAVCGEMPKAAMLFCAAVNDFLFAAGFVGFSQE
jgi:hypothetical protein